MFLSCNKKHPLRLRAKYAGLNRMPHGGRDGKLPPAAKGLTFVELLIAMALMALIVGTLSGLAWTSQQGFQYSEGYGTATQHARVVLDRISRTIYGATANEQFPGCLVVAETVNGWRYPDTLVVWRPSGAAASPSGLPLYRELVIYCPKPNNPNQLVEITAPNDARTVPAITDTSTWLSEIAAIKTNAQSKIVNLTGLLRCSPISSAAGRRCAERCGLRSGCGPRKPTGIIIKQMQSIGRTCPGCKGFMDGRWECARFGSARNYS